MTFDLHGNMHHIKNAKHRKIWLAILTLIITFSFFVTNTSAEVTWTDQGEGVQDNNVDFNLEPGTLDGDILNGVVIRMRPNNCNSKSLNIASNGDIFWRQNVVQLYNIGDSSRFLLTKADEDSYYIDFYDGSGHYEVHDKRFDIDNSDGYDHEGSVVHVVKGNKTAKNKRWQFILQADGTYMVRNKRSCKYWALEDDDFDDENELVQKSTGDSWMMEIVHNTCSAQATALRDLKKYDSYTYKEKLDKPITGCNWMSHIPDDRDLSDLSIPGTHDAGTAKCNMNHFAQCQQHTIQEQLETGVRYFDIRLEKDDGKLYLTHNGFDCFLGDDRLSFAVVKTWISDFLHANPGEAVILQIMVQSSGEDAEQDAINEMKSWDLTYCGENGDNPVMPTLGQLRGKVMFISRFSQIEGINQSTYKIGDKWFGLDAKNWKEGKDNSSQKTVDSQNYEIWTQDKYSLSGSDKMAWIEGSIFNDTSGARARRDGVLAAGKKALVVSYTSCTKTDPQSAARHVHERLIPMFSKMTGDDQFVGIVCNDFSDEDLNWNIYVKNFRGKYSEGDSGDGSVIDPNTDNVGNDSDNNSKCDASETGEHILGDLIAEVAATCTEDGLASHYQCSACKKLFDKDMKETTEDNLILGKLGHKWDEWVVTKEATLYQEGQEQRTCLNDSSHIETRSTPALAKAKATADLCLTMTAKGKNRLKLTWSKVKDADGYDIYMASCKYKNKSYKLKKVKTIKGNKRFTWIKKGLKKNRCYKAFIISWKQNGGKKAHGSKSLKVVAITGGFMNGKCNAKSIKVNKARINLEVGKRFKIKAAVKPSKKGKKVYSSSQLPALRYLSSDEEVASVTKDGKIVAKGKGTCKIYVFAHNGVKKLVSVFGV